MGGLVWNFLGGHLVQQSQSRALRNRVACCRSRYAGAYEIGRRRQTRGCRAQTALGVISHFRACEWLPISTYERNWRRYSVGVIPVARWNARVKLACEEKCALNAISASGSLLAANSAMAISSRTRLK
jgi:hypothetical protein